MRVVLGVVPDLLFRSKIAETAKQVGVDVRFAAAGALAARVVEIQPELVIVDLNAPGDAIGAVASLRASGALVPVLGFFGHVAIETKAKAEASGFTRVLPNSAFAEKLAEILRGTA